MRPKRSGLRPVQRFCVLGESITFCVRAPPLGMSSVFRVQGRAGAAQQYFKKSIVPIFPPPNRGGTLRKRRPGPTRERIARRVQVVAAELSKSCPFDCARFDPSAGSGQASSRVGDRGGRQAGGLENQPRMAASGILTARFQHQGLAPNFFAARRRAWFLVAWRPFRALVENLKVGIRSEGTCVARPAQLMGAQPQR